jgi:hypothetical protein
VLAEKEAITTILATLGAIPIVIVVVAVVVIVHEKQSDPTGDAPAEIASSRSLQAKHSSLDLSPARASQKAGLPFRPGRFSAFLQRADFASD